MRLLLSFPLALCLEHAFQYHMGSRPLYFLHRFLSLFAVPSKYSPICSFMSLLSIAFTFANSSPGKLLNLNTSELTQVDEHKRMNRSGRHRRINTNGTVTTLPGLCLLKLLF